MELIDNANAATPVGAEGGGAWAGRSRRLPRWLAPPQTS